jgi:hypothetical protein
MISVTQKVHFERRGHRRTIVRGTAPTPSQKVGRVPRVSKLMALAIRFDALLRERAVSSLTELAELAQVTQPRMTQIMNLLHLAPDIQEAILCLPASVRGRDTLTERELRPMCRMVAWDDQRHMWHSLSYGLSSVDSHMNPNRSECVAMKCIQSIYKQ